MLGPYVRGKFESVGIPGIVFVGGIAAFNYKGRIVIDVRIRDRYIHDVDKQIRVGAGAVCFPYLRRFDLHDGLPEVVVVELQTTAKEAVCATGKATSGFKMCSSFRVPLVSLEQAAGATLP